MAFLQSAGLTLLSFALLISVVVFFHELGHLIVGKWLGVKAVRFSIGFGPKLFGFQWGETEWRVSALPLGGYVKFAGDNPHEELAPEDRGRGFLEASPAARAAIAFAGPATNFILAAVVFCVLHLVPTQQLAAIVGQVIPGSPADKAGLQSGDRVLSVDGAPVRAFVELQEKLGAHDASQVQLDVQRDGKPLAVHLTPEVIEEPGPLGAVRHARIGVGATPRGPVIAVTRPDGAAAQAGLRDFDTVTRLDGQKVGSYEGLVSALASKLGKAPAVKLDVLHRREVAAPGGSVWVQEPAQLVLQLPTVAAPVDSRGAEKLLGLAGADLSVFAVTPGGPADKAGLRRGDRIVEAGGKPVRWWATEIEAASKAAGASPLQLVVERHGQRVPISVQQTLRKGRDEMGVRTDIPELGAWPDRFALSGEPELVTFSYPLGEALRRGITETADATKVMVQGLAAIATRKVSSEAIGGPLMIADVARQAVDEGLLKFLFIMGVISVNLGLMNLIPIPVLDGGHILWATIEGVRRKPLSLRVREMANLVGLVLVASLMLFALRNDIVRKLFD